MALFAGGHKDIGGLSLDIDRIGKCSAPEGIWRRRRARRAEPMRLRMSPRNASFEST
jgi:hypothetical protein